MTREEIARCEADETAQLTANPLERNVKERNAKAKKVLSPTQRAQKPNAILWIIKNCPEVIDSQICKLIGTTKPTIASIRGGTHADMANLRPVNPMAVGLCSEKDLEKAKGFIRSVLMKRKIEMRIIPELNFVYDDSIEYGNKIESIIEKIHEKEEK